MCGKDTPVSIMDTYFTILRIRISARKYIFVCAYENIHKGKKTTQLNCNVSLLLCFSEPHKNGVLVLALSEGEKRGIIF